jgi:hypothetical protein
VELDESLVAVERSLRTLVVAAVLGLTGVSLADDLWAASWGSVPANCPNLEPMVWLPGTFRAGGDSVDPEALAALLKKRRQGRRVLLMNRYCHSFWGYREDLVSVDGVRSIPGPWADAAMADIAKDWPQILRMTKVCGGSLDYLVADFEEWGKFTSWNLNETEVEAIRRDRRWNCDSLGAPSMQAMTPELAGVSSAAVIDPNGNHYLVWNKAIGRTTAAYMNRAVWQPAVNEYPRLIGSNYRGWRTPLDPAPCGNGHLQPDDNVFGNAVSPSLYGEVETLVSRFIDPRHPESIVRTELLGAVRFSRGPWQSLLVAQQQARSAVRGAEGRPFLPWIAHASYDGTPSNRGFVGFPQDLRCYDEHVRHLAVLGAGPILWWRNPTENPEPDAIRLDRLLSDVNANCLGKVIRPVSTEAISFLSDIVVTGALRRDGKYVWRISASPKVREVSIGVDRRRVQLSADSLGLWYLTDTATPPTVSVVVN